MSKKRRLGRGLGALITEADADGITFSLEKAASGPEAGEQSVALADIVPNRFQPRRSFEPESIEELAASIRAQGLIQPVVVNDRRDGTYELISGERRVRAVRTLGWKQIPALIRQVTEAQLLEMTLVENLQREDLNPIEEARGYERLAQEFSLTQAQIAEQVGKDRATVANTVRLLRLPEVIQQAVAGGALSAGHARQLLAVEDDAERIELARRVIDEDLSVRRLEKIVRDRRLVSGSADKKSGDGRPDERARVHIDQLEQRLREALSTKVRIRQSGDGKGRIEIEFYSFDEFERLMELLNVPPLG
ncbi:MAG TPA: ParB/RepB/Spo0J family partition protein [Candidatus Glassbacteria bacterium]|nr:ParB/RepB/Spo0J family partition protein [Candidatus Glassbacteria bacterium]